MCQESYSKRNQKKTRSQVRPEQFGSYKNVSEEYLLVILEDFIIYLWRRY